MRTALLSLALVAAASAAPAQTAPPASRGALLYGNHCIECHSRQMHWRDQRLARDWTTLKEQVRRWQGLARLGWNEGDIEDVTRYLNDSVYGFERPTQTSGR